jgi:hypothetical protein
LLCPRGVRSWGRAYNPIDGTHHVGSPPGVVGGWEVAASSLGDLRCESHQCHGPRHPVLLSLSPRMCQHCGSCGHEDTRSSCPTRTRAPSAGTLSCGPGSPTGGATR